MSFLLREFRRLPYRLRTQCTDLSQLRCLVIFVGNPRSGTTLVRSLLDAHPHIVISNEVNLLRHLQNGESWHCVAGRMLANARAFKKNPVWNDYSYQLKNSANAAVQVLGDKKAAVTAHALLNDSSLLNRILEWSPVPVRFLHCVRHPLDVIATKTRRNRFGLEQNVQIYFQLEALAARISQQLGPQQVFRIGHETLIDDPCRVLEELLTFLALTATEEYLQACQAIIFKQPRHSRHDIPWQPAAIAAVQQQASQVTHLAGYFDQSRLDFP